MLYIHVDSNHTPEILKQIPKSINDRLNQNSSSEQVFNNAKPDYENALKTSGFKNFELKFNPEKRKNTHKRKRKRKIIWFNPPFNKNVLTDIGKQFLKLINKHFPKTNKLHKIFNRNTIKLSYSCTKNMGRIIKSHNKKLTSQPKNEILPCNCQNDCPLDGNCRVSNVVYKCTASVPNEPDKTYIGLTATTFKERYRNHISSIKKITQVAQKMKKPIKMKKTKMEQLCLLMFGKLSKNKKLSQSYHGQF